MTEAQARKLGYTISRGSYQGTTDDRLGRWYIDHESTDFADRRGPGYATKREALEEIARREGK